MSRYAKIVLALRTHSSSLETLQKSFYPFYMCFPLLDMCLKLCLFLFNACTAQPTEERES